MNIFLDSEGYLELIMNVGDGMNKKEVIMVMVLNKQILGLISGGISIDELFILICIKTENKEDLDAHLSNLSEWQKLSIFNHLFLSGLIEIEYPEVAEYAFDNYKLKGEAISIINTYFDMSKIHKVAEYPLTPDQAFKLEDLTDNKISVNKLDELVEKYRNLFPEGKNNGGGSLQSNFPDVKDKFEKFFKKYKYSHDIVLRATQLYIDGLRGVKDYCQGCNYFILKNDSSQLASYCELVQKNGGKGPINAFEKTM